MMNSAATLSAHVMGRIQRLEALEEQRSQGQAYHPLLHPETQESVGSIRLYQGSRILDKVLEVNICVDSTGMDAYMVMAFTRPDTLFPHLAFDVMVLPDDAAFHIDLLHKRDFSTDIDYVQSVMAPLGEAFEQADNNAHFTPSAVTHLMKALLNPWMASYHCQPAFLPEAQMTIDAYVDHWLDLAADADGIFALTDQQATAVSSYDKAHRAAIFDPRVDILWDMISTIIGQSSRDLILALLRD